MGLLTSLWARQEKRSLENPSTPLAAPDDWLFDSLGSFRASSGVNVNRETALTYDSYWRCVNLISGDVAKLPLCVLKTSEDDNTKTHDKKHPAYKLLRYQFNPYMVALMAKRVLTMHGVSEGNGYGYILRDGAGRPLEIWPLNPMKTFPVREEREDGTGGSLWYVTQVGGSAVKQQRKLRAEDVFHLKGLSFDGLVGYSAVAKMRESLGLALAYENFGSIHFRNNARPGIVLKHPGRLKPEAKQNLRESWERMHSGLENAHRTAILEDGMDVVQMQINLRDSQLLEGKAFSRVQIANFFGVPQHKVGSTAAVSYNSLEQENDSYLTDGHGLGYWLAAWEAECWDKLLTEEQKERLSHVVEFSRRELIRGNMATRTTYYNTLYTIGALNPDEIRAEEGLNPRPDGKGGEYAVSVQVQPPGGDNPPGQGGGKPPKKGKGKPDKPPAGDRARLLLAETFGRMVRRIGVYVRRAAKKPGEFLQGLDAVYAEHRDHLAEMLAPSLYAIGSPTPAAEVVGRLLADFHKDALTAAEVRANDLPEAMDGLCRKWEACAPAAYADLVLVRAKPTEPARTVEQALEILDRLPDAEKGMVALTMPVDEDPPYELDPEDLADAKPKTVWLRDLIATEGLVRRDRVKEFIEGSDPKGSDMDGLPEDRPYVVECEDLCYVYDGHHRLMADQLLGVAQVEVYYYVEKE